MTNNTNSAIIRAARQVFITHGYKRTNMSLISKQSGFSRVTIHKHLKNKDDAFRKSIQQVLVESQQACQPILEEAKHDLPCWLAIENLLQEWVTPVFEEVADHLKLQELKYHAQEIASDLFTDAHNAIENMITGVLVSAVQNKKINLDSIALNESQLATLIVSGMSGLHARPDIVNTRQIKRDLIKVFEVATAI